MRLHRILILAPVLLGGVSLPLAADDIDQIDQLLQAEFRDLSRDMGAALSYKAVAPVEPLGIIGFDIGLEVTATDLRHRAAWEQASSGDAPSTVYVPKVHLHKGLPLGIDVGAFYASVPSSNIDLWGAEIRYALIKGGVAVPAVGLRGTYSMLSGVEQLEFNTKGLELGISKGFALLTPYAGVGRVWIESTPAGTAASTPLEQEKFSETKAYIGANLNFLAGNIAVEADRIGDVTSYSAKFGFRF